MEDIDQSNIPTNPSHFEESTFHQNAEDHPLWKSVVLHLSPGLAALGVYCLLARPVEAAGFPSIMP